MSISILGCLIKLLLFFSYSSMIAKDLKTSSSSSSSTLPVNTQDDDSSDVDMDESDESRKSIITRAASKAKKAQPLGTTLQTATIHTKVPFLMRGTLREYQHIGLDWLVSMYESKLNGILADEMGLGKTIMTISLLAHLACEKGIWGPHLVIVPTSVMLNWDREFKKWCPAFKVICYYGSQKERKLKRTGWSKPNAFHVCITSYNLATQDVSILRRKKWAQGF
jgi:SNF2 family DNA or RNA helicase